MKKIPDFRMPQESEKIPAAFCIFIDDFSDPDSSKMPR